MGDKIRGDFRPGRRTGLQFQVACSHHWLLDRRKRVVRGMYHRLAADDRFARRQMLPEVQWCLGAFLSTGGYWAYQLFFGPIRSIHFGCGGDDEDIVVFFRIPCLGGSSPRDGSCT